MFQKSQREQQFRPNSLQNRFRMSSTPTRLPSGTCSLVRASTCSQARMVHRPSFSRMWGEPVPKDSSPQSPISPSSMRLPKNFHPVGVSQSLMPSFLATLSTAPEVGMLRATPLSPFLRKRCPRLASTASESLGVTKKFLPRIMLRSASPSQAAPKSNSDLASERQPISLTRSWAHSRFGSGCIPLKSGLGSQALSTTFPPSSANTALAYGPEAPQSPSKSILKSLRRSSCLMALKSNSSRISCRQSCTFSTTFTTKSGRLRSTLVKRYSPVEASETRLRKLESAREYLPILVVSAQTWLVNSSCAGPPFLPLNLIPKSSCGPPGLWLAVSSTPPMQLPSLSFNFLMQAEQAGVDISPSSAMCSSSTPFAQATLQMTSMASLVKQRPSPPTSSVLCFCSASLGSALKQLWMKFSTQCGCWNTDTFFRRPEVPSFCPSMG